MCENISKHIRHWNAKLIYFFKIFIYLFIFAVLDLRSCARAFSSCGKRGPLFIAVRRPLTVAASPIAEHRLQMRRLGNCGSRAQLLRGIWDPPRPGLEPVSPALAGRFSTTVPPGKPQSLFFVFELFFNRYATSCIFLHFNLYHYRRFYQKNSGSSLLPVFWIHKPLEHKHEQFWL